MLAFLEDLHYLFIDKLLVKSFQGAKPKIYEMVSDTIENLLTLVYSVLIQYSKLTLVILEYCIKTE